MNKTNGEVFAIIYTDIIEDSTVSHAEFRVYAALKSFANRKTGLAWPSQKKLAARAGMRKADSLRRPLEELEKKGWISKLKKGRPGRNRTFRVYEHRIESPHMVQELEILDALNSCTPRTSLTDHITNNRSDNLTERGLMESPPIGSQASDSFGDLVHQLNVNMLSTVNRIEKHNIRELAENPPPFSESDFNDEIQRVCNGQQPGMYAQLKSQGFYTELGEKLENLKDLEDYLLFKKRGGR